MTKISRFWLFLKFTIDLEFMNVEMKTDLLVLTLTTPKDDILPAEFVSMNTKVCFLTNLRMISLKNQLNRFVG